MCVKVCIDMDPPLTPLPISMHLDRPPTPPL